MRSSTPTCVLRAESQARQADRKAALHSATSAANAGLAPPPVAISRPGRKHDSLRKRPARKSASPIDDEDDEGAATERERDSATPPALLERAASFSAAEPPSNAAPRAPLARTASLPASNAHARAGPGFQGRTGLVYHVYPVPYAPPPAFYPPAMMGAYSTEPPSRTYSTEPFSRTPSLASTTSTSSPLTPPPPRKRKAVSMWDAMPSSSPSSALAQAQVQVQAPRGQKRRTLEWACERARVHEDEPGAEDDDELRNAALLLCGLRGAR